MLVSSGNFKRLLKLKTDHKMNAFSSIRDEISCSIINTSNLLQIMTVTMEQERVTGEQSAKLGLVLPVRTGRQPTLTSISTLLTTILK